jgi:hypothetical protein
MNECPICGVPILQGEAACDLHSDLAGRQVTTKIALPEDEPPEDLEDWGPEHYEDDREEGA